MLTAYFSLGGLFLHSRSDHFWERDVEDQDLWKKWMDLEDQFEDPIQYHLKSIRLSELR